MGRLFDAAAALLGFTREISFEGQAAMWLEQLARTGGNSDAYPFPMDGATLDFRPLLAAVVRRSPPWQGARRHRSRLSARRGRRLVRSRQDALREPRRPDHGALGRRLPK